MKLLTFWYEDEVAVRVPTYGGMDSEFSHNEMRKQSYSVLVPEDNAYWRAQAEARLRWRKGENFKLLLSPDVTTVHLIMSERGRLD